MSSPTILAFQTELINKLQFKSSSKISMDSLLFKTFKFFDLYNNGYLNRSDFFRAIAKCGVVVETHNLDQIFDYYDSNKEAKINYKQFVQRVLFKDDPESMDNKSYIVQSSNKSSSKKVIDPYQGYQNQSQKMKQSKIQLLYSQGQTTEQILDFIRKQIRKDGIVSLLAFSNKLKSMDPNKTHSINGTKLKQVLNYLNQQQIKKIIQQFHPTATGQFNYAQLIYLIKGIVQPERQQLILQVFNLIDVKKAKQIEINVMLQRTKNNHKQIGLATNQYCKFQGIDDGYFTDQDFIDFFEFISFYFLTNENFRSFVLKTFFEQQDQRSEKSTKSRRQYDRQSQLHNEHVAAKKQQYQTDFRKNKAQKPQNDSPYQQRQQQFYDNEEQKKSVSRKSQKQLSESIKPSEFKQVQQIILRIKKRLASKGTKGFLIFQKALKNVDLDNDNCISLDEFKKVIKQQRIDITNTQTNMIFDIFDHKTGLVNYGQLLFVIKGQVSEKRKALNQRIWRRVQKDQQHTTFSQLKCCVNLRGHPDIYNNRRYEDQIMKQIQESILLIQDLNGTARNQQISHAQFMEYLQNLSLSVAEDQLFESIANNFWKIQAQSRIQDEYAGSKKYFDPTKKGYLMDHHRQSVKGGSVSQNAPFGTFSQPTNYKTEHRRL